MRERERERRVEKKERGQEEVGKRRRYQERRRRDARGNEERGVGGGEFPWWGEDKTGGFSGELFIPLLTKWILSILTRLTPFYKLTDFNPPFCLTS